MRQDTRFRAGEAVSARLFAEELSRAFDWIVTVDPHLHRIADLADVFSIPCETVHAAPVVADWINHNIEAPLIVGPDGESSQWVADVARRCNAPFVTFAKSRLADRRVVLSGTAPPKSDRVPVILDDIVSSGHTMAEAVRLTTNTFGVRPWVVGIHAVFAPGAEQALAAANPVGVVTCNTIDHPSNRIDVSVPLADAVGRVCATST
jgi:ribose-phosphate pyrophosphokinase